VQDDEPVDDEVADGGPIVPAKAIFMAFSATAADSRTGKHVCIANGQWTCSSSKHKNNDASDMIVQVHADGHARSVLV
jgi:hypothetical protein